MSTEQNAKDAIDRANELLVGPYFDDFVKELSEGGDDPKDLVRAKLPQLNETVETTLDTVNWFKALDIGENDEVFVLRNVDKIDINVDKETLFEVFGTHSVTKIVAQSCADGRAVVTLVLD